MDHDQADTGRAVTATRIVAVICAALVTSACGTALKVRSVAIPEAPQASCRELARAAKKSCEAFNEPKGLVVNQRARYQVSVSTSQEPPFKIVRNTPGLRGVDQSRLLVVDYARLPFASGRLEVTLDEAQALKKVGITSQAGEPFAVMQSAVESERDVRKAKKAEKAADDDD